MRQIRDEAPNQETRVYLAALEYVAAGLYLLPIRKNEKSLPPKDTHINYGSASCKKSVIERWFDPIEGRFAGWNIGIACGREGGAFAVDIDAKGEPNGFSNLAAFEEEYGKLEACPVATTPSGGQHRLYQWQPYGASSTNKIAKYIDTRGGTEKACRGHIVVFPSIVDGKMYEWVEGGEIPPIPESILTAMGMPTGELAHAKVTQIKKPGRGNENVTEDDLEVQIPLEQVISMLDYINPDELSYDQWLRVGQSIHSQHPGDDGLEVWNEWSKKGNRYKTGECSVRWSGFNEFGMVRIGTLFYIAKEAGWEPGEEDKTLSPWGELIESINSNHAIVMVGGKIRILKERPVHDPMMGTFDLLHREDFKTLFANRMHAFVNPTTGKTGYRSEAEIWLAHEGRRTYENGLGMFPNGAPPGWYNTWHGWTYLPDPEGDCTLFLDHILHIICGGDMDLYTWVVDWMADGIQDPENPKGCAIVIKGQEGTGKGTFADTYGRLFGAHYKHLIDDHHLTGHFNAQLQDALLVFADEVIWGGNKKTAGKLKGMVTEKYTMFERKGVDAVTSRNMMRLIIASNEDWVIPAGPQSRRWLVLEASNSHKQDKKYFAKIHEQMKNGGMGALMHILMNRDITTNLQSAPHTAALDEQREMHQNNSSPVQWWHDVLSSKDMGIPDEDKDYNDQPEWPTKVNRDLLYDSYVTWCKTMQVKPEFKISWIRRMKTFGLKEMRIRDGGRVWVMEIPTWGRAIMTFRQATGININIGD